MNEEFKKIYEEYLRKRYKRYILNNQVTVEELVPCSECNGKGLIVKWGEEEKGLRGCPVCLGSGEMWRPKQPEQPFSFFTLDQLINAGYRKARCWICMGNVLVDDSDNSNCSNCINGWVYFPKEFYEDGKKIREWITAIQKMFPTSWKKNLIEAIQVKVSPAPEVIAINPNLPQWKYPDLSYWENSAYAPPGSAADYLQKEKKKSEKQPDLLVPIGERIPRKFGKL